jgi:aspartate racemase
MSSSNHSSTFWRTARTNARLKNQFPKLKKAPTNIQLPLSLQQERLWYLEQLQPNTSVYNLLHIIRFNGSLEPTILLKTLQELSQRHQVLRTTFSSVGGKPFPIVADSYNPELPIVDLRSLPLAQREQEARKLALEEAKKPFELAVKPPWRVSLLRLDEDEYWLVRTVHHLIFDAWSHSVFMRELGKLYHDFSASQTPTLQEPSFQYVDFAYTQRQWMEESSFTTQLNYWQNHFSEPIASLQLPTDYPSTSLSSYEGKCQHLVCSPELTKALKSLSYQQGVSLFATLLAAFKVLLYGYIRQANLLVCYSKKGDGMCDVR